MKDTTLGAVKPIAALMPVALYDRLRQTATQQGVGLATVLRAAVTEYLDRQGRRKEVAKD
jgi:hypothetical protein